MHVKSILLAAVASGAIFYGLGRFGQGGELPPAPKPGMPSAFALDQPAAEGAEIKPELAQAPPPANLPAGQRQAQPAPPVDESALRYFASQGDTRRFEAELARLRALYPQWKPPTDLNTPIPAGDPELERMWKLFAEGKLSEVRAAIAGRSTKETGWSPPADLVQQLDQAEAAQRLVNASNARQWEQVIRIGTETPALLTCANVDALWRVAEAFVQTERRDRARDAYSYILANCEKAEERLGTMQKALSTLQDEQVNALMALERQNEFASIRDELARRRIGRAAEDPKLTVSADDLRRLEVLANAATTPDDPILLGFYALHHGEPVKASDWFRMALARNGGAKAAEGAVLAFAANGKYQEAEALGSQWLEAGPANRKAYLDALTALLTQEPPPRLEAVVLERIVKTVSADRYALGAAALGWYAYNSGQTVPAEHWFETALAWDREHEPAAFGLALARQRLRDVAGLRAIVAEWRGRSQRIADILDPRRRHLSAREAPPRETGIRPATPEPVAVERMPRAQAPEASPRPPTAAQRLTTEPAPVDNYLPAERPPALREAARPVRGGSCGSGGSGAAALARGWCLLNLKRPASAMQAFEAAMRTGDGQVVADAAAGKAYAALQQGLTNEATAAATSAALPPARRRELSALLLSERFYAQYDAKNFNAALLTLEERAKYAPETTDLMLMRGWSYFNARRYEDARRVFRALYKVNRSSQALSGLTAIDDATQRNRY
jgi:tetratricopeptide (TPR) repeat protein